MNTPILSLVTGTMDRPDSLQRLVVSIEVHTKTSWELIVSDASEKPDDRMLCSLGSRVHIIPERPRLGCSKGYNRAFAKARGEWVIWLNDDCEVMPGYAEIAIRFMEAHPEIGLGALYYSDPNHVGFKVNQCCYGMDYANFGIIRRELGNRVGWFDDELTRYGNDNSLAYRVLLAGKGIAGIPFARIVHHSENDAHRIANNDMPYRVAQAELLKAKYGPRLAEIRTAYDRARSLVTA